MAALLAPTVLSSAAHADGHGPVFGLATPTLGKGQWSSDTALMQVETGQGSRYMARQMLGYGISEDLQAGLSIPVGRWGDEMTQVPRTRLGTMMGSFGDLEASILWRFHRTAPAVGTRYESTMLLGISLPTEKRRSGVNVGPAANIGLVTGYASRTWYWWLGGGMQRYFDDNGGRLGDLGYVSAVLGYRPRLFQRDYPNPDWRIFLEAIGEHARRDKIAGRLNPDSGGNKILVGPSVLGLYGKWGISGGVLFPAHADTNGIQTDEKYRGKFIVTYWF
ncbi:MAG: hypothetical protein WDZ63_06460 [Burkholderiales bacterium]